MTAKNQMPTTADTPTAPITAKRRYFRPRFTLAALLILVTVISPPLAYVAQRRAWNLRRKAAMAALAAHGASFKYGGLASFMTKAPPALTWWQNLCGDLEGFTCVEIVEASKATGSSRIRDEDLGQLALLSELEVVSIVGAETLTDDGLRALAALPHLKQFLVQNLPHIEGSFLESWAKTNQIENLDFVGLPELRGIHLNPLKKFTRLKSISFYRCEGLTDAECRQVDLPRQLTYLQIGRTPIGDDALNHWLGQSQIEWLSLDVDCSRAIALGLANQTRLKSLQIVNSPLIDEDLHFLKDCGDLEVLSLRGMPLNGSFLKKISSDTKLMIMALHYTPLTDDNAAELCRFSALVSLELSWTPITGEFFSGATWTKLNHLGLQGSQFTERGKANLASISTPQVVEFPSNWSVLDFQLYRTAKPPMNITLNAAHANENNSSANLLGIRFVTPKFHIQAINRCPRELMASVIRLYELAKDSGSEPK